MMKDLGRDSWKGECSARENYHNAEVLSTLKSMILKESCQDKEKGKSFIDHLLPYFISYCRKQKA